MKRSLLIFIFSFSAILGRSQDTIPEVNANFGIEADLRANYYDGAAISGTDDWFNENLTDTAGNSVIDTSTAAQILNRYATNPPSINQSFEIPMAYNPYTVKANKLLLAAAFVRDYHGLTDSTVFASGSNKNGMSPANWSCPVSQSVPDKNEILDMMIHLRRDGPSITDSLWLFGGLSIENTNGDRYFDFEMYQTDLTYNRSTQTFSGYGPDAGHTSWVFSNSGDVISPGDIIFSASYGSSTLTSLDARIWINKASMSITPKEFDWTGTFDGATNGATFGYAGIKPKSGGDYYSGTENNDTTWAGSFDIVRGNGTLLNYYLPGQYLEFGVNLSKLGLDPYNMAGDLCENPFKSILVKTRASTSFTAALKDFVAPFKLFQIASPSLIADATSLCGAIGSATIQVKSPSSGSTYSWYTPDGNISSYQGDTVITVDQPGTYYVISALNAVCPDYTTDSIIITQGSNCYVLGNVFTDFTGKIAGNLAILNWSVNTNQGIKEFEIQESTDGIHFNSESTISPQSPDSNSPNYMTSVGFNANQTGTLSFRVEAIGEGGQTVYSKIITLNLDNLNFQAFSVSPNPFRNEVKIVYNSILSGNLKITLFDALGQIMLSYNQWVNKGSSSITISGLQSWPAGIYNIQIQEGNKFYTKKIIKMRQL
jgi:Secretion system C-terminal sorting domain